MAAGTITISSIGTITRLPSPGYPLWGSHSKARNDVLYRTSFLPIMSSARSTISEMNRCPPDSSSDLPEGAVACKRRKLGANPFKTLPLEIVERILNFLSLRELILARRINRSFNILLRSPSLFQHVIVATKSTSCCGLIRCLKPILPQVRSLSLRSAAKFTLEAIIPNLSSRLRHLDLSFSAVTDQDVRALAASGCLAQIEGFKLKGCRAIQDGIGLSHILPNCTSLDLSWSAINTLPARIPALKSPEIEAIENFDDSGFFEEFCVMDSEEIFPRLQEFSISSTGFLSTALIIKFISNLPNSLVRLDLSQIPLHVTELAQLNQTRTNDANLPCLKQIDVRGNDLLTVRDIHTLETILNTGRTSQDDWVQLIHSAVLESDDEQDVRKFVQLVAGIVNRA